MDLSDLTGGIPETWYFVDPDPATRWASARSEVDARLAVRADLGPYRELLIDLVCGCGAEAEERSALFAALFWEPGPAGPDVADLMVIPAARGEPASVEREIEAVTAVLHVPEAGDVGERRVSEVKLPLGQAVRLRLLSELPGGQERPLVVDASQIWIPLDDRPGMVVVSGTTPCLELGDALAATVEEVAATLTVRVT